MKNQNEEINIENMKSYASIKYGREFTVENFQAAKDETYTNILTLNDGEYIFNVYQSGNDEASDDYPQVIVNKKMIDYLKANANSSHDIFANFMFTNGNTMALDYAKDSDVSTILDNYSLLKIVVVVEVNGNISDYSDDLFNIYREVMGFNPKYIDFEIIQVDTISSDLKEMLNNLPAFYDSAWTKYSEVKEYLSITDTNISTSDELIMGGK